MYERDAFQCQADEGRGPHDPQSFGEYHRLGENPLTNGFVEALNGPFQTAKRKARGYHRLSTIRTIIFMIAGNLDFCPPNPRAAPSKLKRPC